MARGEDLRRVVNRSLQQVCLPAGLHPLDRAGAAASQQRKADSPAPGRAFLMWLADVSQKCRLKALLLLVFALFQLICCSWYLAGGGSAREIQRRAIGTCVRQSTRLLGEEEAGPE